ncbi:MAG: hypothetical protein ACQCN5_04925 [Candidatus Bathyarchaeia archaeon]
MNNWWVAVLVATVFFVIAFLILLEQKVTFGLWFQTGDLHHETFAIASAALGIGIIIGALLAGNTQNTFQIRA